MFILNPAPDSQRFVALSLNYFLYVLHHEEMLQEHGTNTQKTTCGEGL